MGVGVVLLGDGEGPLQAARIIEAGQFHHSAQVIGRVHLVLRHQTVEEGRLVRKALEELPGEHHIGSGRRAAQRRVVFRQDDDRAFDVAQPMLDEHFAPRVQHQHMRATTRQQPHQLAGLSGWDRVPTAVVADQAIPADLARERQGPHEALFGK